MSNPTATEAQELAASLGQSTEPPLTIKTETITVEPLCINQIAEIMLCIDRLAEKGVRVDALFSSNQPSASGVSYTQLVLRGGKDFIAILAIACKQTPDFVGSLNVLELARLAGLVWKVNKDFFGQNQIEILKAFGLDETHVTELKNLVDSIKSLVTSAPTASPMSADSLSAKSPVSPERSNEKND